VTEFHLKTSIPPCPGCGAEDWITGHWPDKPLSLLRCEKCKQCYSYITATAVLTATEAPSA
jgi:hypothetical protein